MKAASSPAWLEKADGWLNTKRVSRYPWLFAALFYGLWLFWILTGSGMLDRNGKLIGSDFLTMYAGSLFAHTGDPGRAYELAPFHQAQVQVVGTDLQPLMWRYPPIAFLIVWPLSLLPYFAACFLWLGATSAAFCVLVKKIAPHPLAFPLTLSFGGFYQNWIQGQNACLTGCLLAGGCLVSARHPWWGGVLLGFLAYKPQYGVLVLPYLACRREWKTLAAMALTVLALAAASLAAYGFQPWLDFQNSLSTTLLVVEKGYDPIEKLITFYGSLILLGIDPAAAKAAHLALAAGLALACCATWRKSQDPGACLALLACGTLLVTPYAYDYEFALMGIPLAWLLFHNDRHGWKPGEKTLCALVWSAPFLAPALAHVTPLQAGWIPLLALFWMIQRKASTPLREVA